MKKFEIPAIDVVVIADVVTDTINSLGGIEEE